MPNKETFLLLSVAMGFIATAPYIRGIVRREIKPHMISWLIWAIVCATGGTVQLLAGGGKGSWLLIVNAVYCFGIFIASLRRGTRDIKPIDWLVLVLALSALPLGYMTDTLLLSAIIAIGIDAMAYIPTIRKSWHKPREESALSWGLSSLTFTLSVLALEQYTPTTYLYPATFIVINLGMVAYLLLRRQALLRNA